VLPDGKQEDVCFRWCPLVSKLVAEVAELKKKDKVKIPMTCLIKVVKVDI